MTQLQFVDEKIFRKAETFRNRVELTTFLERTVAPVEEDMLFSYSSSAKYLCGKLIFILKVNYSMQT